MQLDVVLEAVAWGDVALERLCLRAGEAVASEFALSDAAEVVVLACDDARIAALNADFRDKPQPTNVLSWPCVDLAAVEDGAMPHLDQAEDALGDIAIAFETCAREAHEQGKALEDHVTHLLIHGLLHLLGFDHIRDKDADLMEGIESRILAKLGIADPYAS